MTDACAIPGAGLEPCPRCGGPQVWVTSHSQCERCRWITPCCEGAPAPLAVTTPTALDGASARTTG